MSNIKPGSPKLDNRRLENVAWSGLNFCCDISDGRVRIWRKEHESMDPSCLVSMAQAAGGGVMVWEIFSWHTLSPLVPIEHCLNATAYSSIVEHVHLFMTTVYLSSDDYFQQVNAPCHKAQIISDWFLEHDNEFTSLKWPPQSPRSQSNRAPLGCGGTRNSHHGCAADKSVATA